jgi:hypothetical protein
MVKHSQAGKIKYILSLISLSFFIVASVLPDTVHVADTTKVQSKATAGIHGKDTTKVQRKDSSKVQPKDTSKVQKKDSVKVQPKDTINRLADSVIYKQSIFSHEELIRGERLFYGLVYLGDKSINCVACHNTQVSDTLNWNPDALEISKKYLSKSAYDLSRILLKPLGQKMGQVHKNFHLLPEDIVLIKAYMDRFVEIGLKPVKPVITNFLLFIIATILLLFSIVDLTISKILKRRWINYFILLFAGIFITNSLVVNAISLGRSKDYSPAQPDKIFTCSSCRAEWNRLHLLSQFSAPYSKTAGIPPLNVCMNCHLMVRNGTRSGVFEISKVISSYENHKPVEWIKVHNLPDHVFFSHAQHVSAGGVDAQNVMECKRNGCD